MSESVLSQTSPILDTASPPPKCAICLGVCSNKCFSNSCMHEFCFLCLLEWSKIKAECPLCKKPFRSILHNIKSNTDYEEYNVADAMPSAGIQYVDMDDGNFLYIPPSRHFQFRTTFTVDPGGELAIQQMLLSHPLTNYGYPYLPRYRYRHGSSRLRGVSSATTFRRSIYALNYWVYAPPDITGRFRDISPEFYREHPASRNRLVPWLNRELNALLRENTQQVMNLVDIIMEHLPRWHIRSRSFRNLLLPHMTEKTDHFLHEFYNFMRSPYDMIGYDRHITYAEQPTTYTFTISDYDEDLDEDSDIAIVSESGPRTVDNNPFRQPPTLEVIEINSSGTDSDVIIRDTPVEVVDLLQSESDNNIETNVNDGHTPPYERELSDHREPKKPLLPLKIRLKRKRQSREKNARKKRTRRLSCSTCSDDSDDSSRSSSSSDSSRHRSKRKYKYRKSLSRHYKEFRKNKKSKYRIQKYKKVASTSSSSSSCCSSTCSSSSSSSTTTSTNSFGDIQFSTPRKPKTATFDSDDNIPLSKIRNKEIQNRTSHTVTSDLSKNNWANVSTNNEQQSQPSCSMWSNNTTSSPVVEDEVCSIPTNPMFSYQYPPMHNYSVSNRSSFSSFQSMYGFTMPTTPTFTQPHLSYTPPLEPNVPYYKNEIRYDNIYNQDPICLNIGMEGLPFDPNPEMRMNCIPSNNNSTNTRVQSVIVKKERKLPSDFCLLKKNSDSDD